MVKQWTLGDLVADLTGRKLEGMEMPIRPVIDSRKAEAGAVFFAFVGENVDGHTFVADAMARGAVAAVIEHDVSVDATVIDSTQRRLPSVVRPPLLIRVPSVLGALQASARAWRCRFAPRVVGVTGSVGKTTTKELVARVLSRRFQVLSSGGSYNNEIGLPLTLLELHESHERVVLEMGMYVRGDIRTLADIAQPHVGVVTNVGAVHAERAGTLEDIAAAKRELVEALPAAPEGVAVLNADDPRVRSMAECTQARVFTYGRTPEADLWADDVRPLGLRGIHLCLRHADESFEVEAPLLGQHSMYTILRGVAVGLVEGLTWPEILAAVQEAGTRLRLVMVNGANGSQIVDDSYNSSPTSAIAALDFLATLPGRKVAVLGDMLELGQYEEEGHFQVGARAASVVQQLVTVGARARLMAQAAELAGLSSECIRRVQDSPSAIPVLSSLIQPGDVVLVKGSRGIRMEQIVAALRDVQTLGLG